MVAKGTPRPSGSIWRLLPSLRAGLRVPQAGLPPHMTETSTAFLTELFNLRAQVAVVTGGTGVLGGAMAAGLARAGASVGVLGRRRAQAEVAAAIEARGGSAMALT